MAPHRGRGKSAPGGRIARSGIRTRGGRYRKFDSQRIRHEPTTVENEDESSEEDQLDIEDSDMSENEAPIKTAYADLLTSLKTDDSFPSERPAKRRRTHEREDAVIDGSGTSQAEPSDEEEILDGEVEAEIESHESDDDMLDERVEDGATEASTDPYTLHFEVAEGATFLTSLQEVKDDQRTQERSIVDKMVMTKSTLKSSVQRVAHHKSNAPDVTLKPRLKRSAASTISNLNSLQELLLSSIPDYADLLFCGRTHSNAKSLREVIALHAVNHVLKGRDKILKNNSRLAQAQDDAMLEFRDQGFTRPKVLIMTETRQMCSKYAEIIAELFSPEQQENKQRFIDSFTAPITDRDMPGDFRELFDGNNDNNFITTIKFTRKTMKYFSAFYQSDIILASPLGLRRIIEHEDKKKRDHDFLSSIEILVVDQADAMQMQNWENVELVLQHLNIQPKQLRDCDVNRVRHWYLDGQAQYLRQTVVLSAYLTPELNKLYNSNMQSIAGKLKLTPQSPGSIQAVTGFGIKQTFSRFQAKSPSEDPDARFKFFTTSVLPPLLRKAQSEQDGAGILIFVPSYFDFLRVRNFFATSTVTENISFGAIHDYSEASEQRRARSHFLTGKHSVLLYTQRAHHFFRLRIRGAKKVVMYGLPENEVFFREIVAGFVGSTLEDGKTTDCSVRCLFSKFDALKLERIVGSERVKSMLSGAGDTFDFL